MPELGTFGSVGAGAGNRPRPPGAFRGAPSLPGATDPNAGAYTTVRRARTHLCGTVKPLYTLLFLLTLVRSFGGSQHDRG